MNRKLSFITILCSSLLNFPSSAKAFDLISAWHAAREHDADFAASRFALAAGKEKYTQGRALLLPQATLTGNYSRNTSPQPSYSLFGPNEKNQRVTTRGYSINLNQPLFDVSRYAKYQKGISQSELAEIQFNSAKQQLIVEVAKAFFGLLLARDTLIAAQTAKNTYDGQRVQARAAFEKGLATITDVYESQAGYDEALANEILAQNAVTVSAAALSRLTGLPANNAVQPSSDNWAPLQPPAEPLSVWLDTALANSLELKKAEQQLALAEQDLLEKRANRLPVVNLVAGYQDNRNTNPAWTTPPSGVGTNIGVTVTLPLFAGGGINSQIREAAAQKDSSLNQREAVRRKVTEEISRLYLSVTHGAALVKAQQLALNSAKNKVQATRTGKEVGLRNSADLLKAEQDYTEAIKNLAEARYGYLNAQIALAQSAGILEEEKLQEINKLIQK